MLPSLGIISRVVLILMGSITLVHAAKLGPNEVPPGEVLEFTVPLPARQKWMVANAGYQNVTWARGGLAVPQHFQRQRSWPVLIVSVPSGGSAISGLSAFTNTALGAGWLVLAADGPPVRMQDDTQTWRWAMTLAVLEYLNEEWPESRTWPIACAGFSGGAKRSGYLAPALLRQGYPVIGLFMGGCNEDRASAGAQMYQAGARFRQVPIFLSSGLTDTIASPRDHDAVRQSLLRNGFQQVRLATYPGGHELHAAHVTSALDWFQRVATAAGPNAPPVVAGAGAALTVVQDSIQTFLLSSSAEADRLAGSRVLVQGTATNLAAGPALLLPDGCLHVDRSGGWKPSELGRKVQVIGHLIRRPITGETSDVSAGSTATPAPGEWVITNATCRVLSK